MKVDRSQFLTKEYNSEEKLYTLIGNENYLDDQGFPRSSVDADTVFAKAVKNKLNKKFNSDIQYRFYIKTDPNKNIHNPIKIYSSLKDKSNRSFLNKVCKSEVVFTEVTQSIFNQYINFLKTQNTQWLESAQRELK